LLYLVVAALALFVGLVIWRQTALVVTLRLLGNDDVARLAYMISVVALSLGLLTGILASEPYLRTGMAQGRLLRRFLKVMLSLGAFGLLGVLLQMWLLAY
jgi:hypothetical protein